MTQLKFDEYLLLVHPDAHDGVDSHKEEGIGEGGQLVIGDEAVDGIENIRLDAKWAEDDGEELTHYVEEEGIHAEG